MTIDDLRSVGVALYGPRWQRELGRAIGTDHRTLVYWLAGKRRLPADLGERIDAVLIRRITELVAARRDLKQALKKAT
jgi:hypothetical protein